MIKQRSVAVCIILSIVTCGIYGLYWLVCLNDDTNTVAGTPEDTSGVVVLVLSIVTCSIYLLYWLYKQGNKIDQVKTSKGIASSNSGIIYLVLAIVGLSIVSYALMQNELNQLAA
ncbi:MAG: DUF4234 domain-containing protein [Eubacterium sp.]|nr:DUF4234 domain-containing protein [Eubacterium sp.]